MNPGREPRSDITGPDSGEIVGERHYDVQLVGGRVLLEGLVAEMETGEGKTLRPRSPPLLRRWPVSPSTLSP
jgi:hypothetical protein